MRHVVMCTVRLYNIFPTLSHKGMIFREKKVIRHKNVCFDFLRNFCLQHFSFKEDLSEISSKEITSVFMYSTRYSCQIWMRLYFCRHIFKQYWNINFHKSQSSGNRVVPCGQTDMPKLIDTFRNFTNAKVKYKSILENTSLHNRSRDLVKVIYI